MRKYMRTMILVAFMFTLSVVAGLGVRDGLDIERTASKIKPETDREGMCLSGMDLYVTELDVVRSTMTSDINEKTKIDKKETERTKEIAAKNETDEVTKQNEEAALQNDLKNNKNTREKIMNKDSEEMIVPKDNVLEIKDADVLEETNPNSGNDESDSEENDDIPEYIPDNSKSPDEVECIIAGSEVGYVY